MAESLRADELQNVVRDGGNTTELKREIKVAIDRVIALKAERRAASATINEIKSGLGKQGIPKKAFQRALEDFETHATDDGAAKQREIDAAYWITREAAGLSSEPDMFEGGKTDPLAQSREDERRAAEIDARQGGDSGEAAAAAG